MVTAVLDRLPDYECDRAAVHYDSIGSSRACGTCPLRSRLATGSAPAWRTRSASSSGSVTIEGLARPITELKEQARIS